MYKTLMLTIALMFSACVIDDSPDEDTTEQGIYHSAPWRQFTPDPSNVWYTPQGFEDTWYCGDPVVIPVTVPPTDWRRICTDACGMGSLWPYQSPSPGFTSTWNSLGRDGTGKCYFTDKP